MRRWPRLAERIRAIEEAHAVPRTRQPAAGPGRRRSPRGPGGPPWPPPWAWRARDVGELAPGDFVRTIKSVADLAQQVSHTAADPAVAAAAREAVDLLLRGVVRRRAPRG